MRAISSAAPMLARLWRRFLATLDQRGAAVFMTLSLAVGVVVGVAAAALIGAIELVAEGVAFLADRIGSHDIAVLIAIPVGLLAAWGTA